MVQLIFQAVLISDSFETYRNDARNIGGRIKPQGLACSLYINIIYIYIVFFYRRLDFTANPHNVGRTSSNTSQVFFILFFQSLLFFWKEAHTCFFTRDRLIKILWCTGFFGVRLICVCKTF